VVFKPNLSVKEGLDHLARHLDDVIATRLSKDLGDRPWTVVLEILDEKKGFARGYKYWTHDLQAQLRMITERLGQFGYPFDDKQRTVTTLGNELRIVRKQMAHMYDFSIEEAFRSNDFCVRLLEHFEVSDGLDEARRIRLEALAAYAAAEGVTEQAAIATAVAYQVAGAEAEETAASASSEPAPALAGEGDDEPVDLDVVSPDAVVLQREPSVIGDMRLEFEPWRVVQIGATEILDDLPKKAAKEKVRAAAVEIATLEGPIHVDRLVQLTAQSFGLQRVRSSREKKLKYQIQQAGLFVDDAKFVWPREIDPDSWREFRPNDSTADRAFEHVSPVEIANAARFIREQSPDIDSTALEASVLRTFGRSRRTKRIAVHLAVGMSYLGS
jgi:hypothetical protein